jgi:D-lactate dehydrogenase (cytochrome)
MKWKWNAECIELLDDKAMGAINTYGQSVRKWPEKDSLFIKFQGPTESSIFESIKLTKGIVEQHGATRFETAKDQKEAEALWADRKNAHYAGLALMPGCMSWPTDVWYALTDVTVSCWF